MAHFPLSGKLLSETTFLNFISRVNEDFVSLDEAEYEKHQAAGKSFTLNTKTWLSKCNDIKTTRQENDASLTFCTFALNRLRALLNFDIDLYVKEYRSGKKGNSSEFFSELTKLKEYISEAPYLTPISTELIETLDNVPKDILLAEEPPGVGVLKEGEDFLTWNGPIADLFALFQDLRNKPSTISSKPVLDYSTSDLGAFIIKHFRDSNGDVIPATSTETFLSTSQAKPGKRGKVTS